ncbi:MAG TPA: mandelate racemase/muconate lactonizing enzyme family protein [Bryobacteraceae bacterium]|nr:mandelate racemase/muconate lactonizing enzyme family protein [Bryobacteraceae bacterium]
MLPRRSFLKACTGTAVAGLLSGFEVMAAPQKGQTKIRDIKVMMMQGGRTYTLIKVEADSGHYGIAEAYGSPGVGVKEQVLDIAQWLKGKDPLSVDVLYTMMGNGTRNLSGTRTDGSAHNLLRAVSGVEMAIWDLAGKILEVPTAKLLGGRFRDKVRVYDHSAPKDMNDKTACKEWAASVKADPAGFTAHKFGFPHTSMSEDPSRDRSNRLLTTKELMRIRQGYENVREAIGWDHDIMVHCHWEFDVRTSIQIAEAVAPIKPLWLEDPLVVDYSESWKRITENSPVPICMGENLARRQGFKDFIVNSACDIINPDLRNSGGFLETKRIADMADLWGIPMSNHNTGSLVCTMATVQWASSIRDYMICETVTGKGDWMDQVLLLDGAPVRGGYITMGDKPGLGIELNPDVVRAHLAPGETWWG